MKKRNGFVSNSSSSSFIIGHGEIDTVATDMLNTLINDDSEWPRSDIANEWKSNLSKALKMEKVKNGSIGITFPSCNYDTYIVKEGNRIYVSTCNNTDWSEAQEGVIDFGVGSDNGSEDESHRRVQDSLFFDLRDESIHSCEKYDLDYSTITKCPEKGCGGGYSYVEKDGQKICAWCYKGVLGGKKKVVKTKTMNMEVTNKHIKEIINGLDCAYDQGQEINSEVAQEVKDYFNKLLKQRY